MVSKKLAEEAGLHWTYISGIERGKRNLGIENVVKLARAEIGKHAQKITLTPEGRTYIASGSWDLLGAGAVAGSMVPGARIELATPAFSGRRSTTELPRHFVPQNCIGLPHFSQFSTAAYLKYLVGISGARYRCPPFQQPSTSTATVLRF
jgi:hypothetical protein